jgi:hypothetical protein
MRVARIRISPKRNGPRRLVLEAVFREDRPVGEWRAVSQPSIETCDTFHNVSKRTESVLDLAVFTAMRCRGGGVDRGGSHAGHFETMRTA